MNRRSSFTEMPRLLPRVDGQQFGHDADGDLFGAVGADIEADRPKQAIHGASTDLLQNLVGTGARAKQSDVGGIGRQKDTHPFAIVCERMCLDDSHVARLDNEGLDVLVRSELEQPSSRRESL
jgi:hypothetical protein